METSEIYQAFTSTTCAGCSGKKRTFAAFCTRCYGQLPRALKNSLWQRFGAGFEQAYQASLSWFRLHPLQGEHRAHQQSLLFSESK
jgi:DnaJ-class molecular chaperone